MQSEREFLVLLSSGFYVPLQQLVLLVVQLLLLSRPHSQRLVDGDDALRFVHKLTRRLCLDAQLQNNHINIYYRLLEVTTCLYGAHSGENNQLTIPRIHISVAFVIHNFVSNVKWEPLECFNEFNQLISAFSAL